MDDERVHDRRPPPALPIGGAEVAQERRRRVGLAAEAGVDRDDEPDRIELRGQRAGLEGGELVGGRRGLAAIPVRPNLGNISCGYLTFESKAMMRKVQ